MLITARILTGLLAFIAMATGVKSMLFGLAEVDGVAQELDNTFRYYSGVWAGVGVGLAYCAAMMPDSNLLRSLMFAVFIGGIGRVVGMPTYQVIEKKVMVGAGIEIIVPLVVIALVTLAVRPG